MRRHDNIGLCLDGGRMMYGWKSGFGLNWMPGFLMDALCKAWNKVACFILGHHPFMYPDDDRTVCVFCCKEM